VVDRQGCLREKIIFTNGSVGKQDVTTDNVENRSNNRMTDKKYFLFIAKGQNPQHFLKFQENY
jgi:hypothetical protein